MDREEQFAGESARRSFIKKMSLLSAGAYAWPFPLTASSRKDGLLNADKTGDAFLDGDRPGKVHEHGKPTSYLKSKHELRYIGMPAGGLHAGTVYMGGDGRLWLWQIYNDDREGVDPKTVAWNDGKKERDIRSRDGACYVEPAIASNKRVLEQGFAIKLDFDGKTIIKELKEDDWNEIIFEATYPIATVHYVDKNLPVEVVLRGGGIFVPLDADDSALPATVFSIHIRNLITKPIKVSVLGWLENGAHKITADKTGGIKHNRILEGNNCRGVFSFFRSDNADAGKQRDAGTTSISCLASDVLVNTNIKPWPVTAQTFTGGRGDAASADPLDILVGGVTVNRTLESTGDLELNFLISWHVNHPLQKLDRLNEVTSGAGYYYGKRFKDAAEVTRYIALHFTRLYGQTRLWQDSYYDASLPHWFLERTFLNVGTVATANTYRFADNRFWGWEGVNACEGTCTHVWQYAQALGRIFPSLERDTRQRVDLGIALLENGGISFRAEYTTRPAIDGQAGTILRFYREHQMSADYTFLKSNWDKIKKTVRFMLAQDKNRDGMTDTPMENTLDAVWEGEIAWIVGLCIAAARAAQAMAEEMQDNAFALVCKEYVEKGCRNMEHKLFNGEYFIHRPDPVAGRKKLGSYNTCHIDQVYGQSWAFQVGLGRLWDRQKTLSALKALWKYNFKSDVGPYIKTHTGGRPYALEGEAGLIMNTNPYDEPKPYGEDVTWQIGYFNECMTGFEHQVASHMMAENMVEEAMTLTKAIHDRYHAAKRNPYNEIECSDHYARAMASYGTFITACGFEYHGPKGYIGFNPKISRENFKAAFTAAEGWGSYSQAFGKDKFDASYKICSGKLNLRSMSFVWEGKHHVKEATIASDGKMLDANFIQEGNKILVELKENLTVETGSSVVIRLS